MIKYKNILVAGYYGYGNIGDELILRTMLEFLEQYDINIFVLSREGSNQYQKTAKKIQIYNRYNIFDILKAMKKTEIMLLGGGCLFQDKTGVTTVLYYSFLIIAAKIFRNKVYLISNSIGPLKKVFSRIIIKVVFAMIDHISIREEVSVKYLRKRSAAGFVLTSDLLYIKAEAYKQPYAARSRLNKIGLIPNYHMTENTVNILKRYSLVQKIPLNYILFFEKDIEIIQKMNIKMEDVTIAEVNFASIREILGGLDFLISFRLHGAILADIFLLPYLLIGDDEKFEGIADGKLYLKEKGLSTDELLKKTHEIFQNYEDIRKDMRQALPGKQHLSRKNFDLFFSPIGSEMS